MSAPTGTWQDSCTPWISQDVELDSLNDGFPKCQAPAAGIGLDVLDLYVPGTQRSPAIMKAGLKDQGVLGNLIP